MPKIVCDEDWELEWRTNRVWPRKQYERALHAESGIRPSFILGSGALHGNGKRRLRFRHCFKDAELSITK